MEDGNQNLTFLKKKISIVDYKGSNLLSLYNAFKYIGFEAEITSDLKIIKDSDFIILPGVGSFAHSMKTIKKLGIDKIIIEKSINEESIIFGICLGMQLLFSSSNENKYTKGLSIFDSDVSKFKDNLKIPHMGFNSVSFNKNSKLFNRLPNNSDFYFANSYKINFDEKYTDIVSSSFYGEKFISSIEFKNIFATQFHPEKSHDIGLEVLKNLIELDA